MTVWRGGLEEFAGTAITLLLLDLLIPYFAKYSRSPWSIEVKRYRSLWFPRVLFLAPIPLLAAFRVITPKIIDDFALAIFGGASFLLFAVFVSYDVYRSVERPVAKSPTSSS